ncbi:unnamed protein product [Prunus brigantina]
MLIHNLEPTPVTYNVLINGLCVYGDLMDADRLLVSLCDCNINLTKVAYTTLIKAHCAKDDVHRAVGLFHQMVEKGFEISIRDYSAVINRLCKRCLITDAKYFFCMMLSDGICPDQELCEMRNPKEVEKMSAMNFTRKLVGEVEFRSVLYIPGMGPLNNEDVVNAKTKNICLYVKWICISDDFDGDLFPRHLSFVKGVVDSDDLPLNVSQEILQESRIVRIMRKQLKRKTFDMIQEISESENREDYKKLWENFGSLDDYVENMPENQNAIYYLAADSLKRARFLEKLVQKDIEVSVLPTLVVVHGSSGPLPPPQHGTWVRNLAACKNAPDSTDAKRAQLNWETRYTR